MKARKLIFDILTYLLVLGGIVVFAGPFIWMVSTALKLPADQYTRTLIPNPATLVNFTDLFRKTARIPAADLQQFRARHVEHAGAIAHLFHGCFCFRCGEIQRT